MDWKTTRVTAILEQALVEDHATHDATTELTLNPKLSASAAIVAKQDCVLSGAGSNSQIPRDFPQTRSDLDPGLRSCPSSRNV